MTRQAIGQGRMARLLAPALAALALWSPAAAQTAPSPLDIFADPDARTSEASLLGGWREDDGRIAGFRIELADGWKTYWRKPGDSGIPPRFDWSGSENLAGVEILWPAPVTFDSFGLLTIGYKRQMVLPLKLEPVDPARPIRLSLNVFYGVCSDICIPAEATLSLEIAPDAPEADAAPIRAALAALPRRAEDSGLTSAGCVFDGAGETRDFTARLRFDPAPRAAPVVVAEGPDGVWFGPLDARLSGDEITASGEIRVDSGVWLDRSALTLTLIDPAGAGALSVEGCAVSG